MSLFGKGPVNEGANQLPSEQHHDTIAMQMEHDRLKDEQSLMNGITGGGAAAVLGAILWGVITAYTHFQIGWMAVGVGFLVGYAVRIFGKGIDPIFGVAGAVLSLFGCLLGNLLGVAVEISVAEEVDFLTILEFLYNNPAAVVGVMVETFHPMDLLFYGIALIQGYKGAFRPVKASRIRRTG